MAYKDFFGDIYPLAEVRDAVPLIPTKAKPVQKQTVSVEDPFTEQRMVRETMNAEQLREDMRLMYRMIEGTRDDLRQRDREYAELREEMRARDNNRERDMLALMEKLSEIQLEMTANRDSTKSKTGLVDSPKFNPNNEGQDKLPTMYWLPKLHKRPYKARFIANSSSCTTTELSKLLTSCLTAIKSHVIR